MPSIRVVAFAQARELLAASSCALELQSAATVGEAWAALCERYPKLAALEAVRFARNNAIASNDEPLQDGDELAVLPAVGGG
jgi:molybdopterin converting factor small subunit